MTFRVGQRVVCVNDDFSRSGIIDEQTPVRGCVYTVRGLHYAASHRCLGLFLEEIVNQERQYSDEFGEVSWKPRRFRPVKETNIDIFTAMLSPTPKQKTKENA